MTVTKFHVDYNKNNLSITFDENNTVGYQWAAKERVVNIYYCYYSVCGQVVDHEPMFKKLKPFEI